MKRNTFLLALLTFLFSSFGLAAGEGWMTDYDAAFKKAKAEKKQVFIKFTGSDWCPPCQAMDKRVFSKSAFVEKASKDYVLLILDFPRSNSKLSQANEKYAKRYNVQSFPTVVIANASGSADESFIASKFPSVKKMLAKIGA